jgi:hypothetical protein
VHERFTRVADGPDAAGLRSDWQVFDKAKRRSSWHPAAEAKECSWRAWALASGISFGEELPNDRTSKENWFAAIDWLQPIALPVADCVLVNSEHGGELTHAVDPVELRPIGIDTERHGRCSRLSGDERAQALCRDECSTADANGTQPAGQYMRVERTSAQARRLAGLLYAVGELWKVSLTGRHWSTSFSFQRGHQNLLKIAHQFPQVFRMCAFMTRRSLCGGRPSTFP